jgi:hypothetical protein
MTILAEQLSPLLAPKYVAELQTQIVVDLLQDEEVETSFRLPDVTIVQPAGSMFDPMAASAVTPIPVRLAVPMALPTRLVSIYIRQRQGDKVVVVIELLSPINKRPGDKRREYLEKRAAFLAAPFHLVEIDLLRRWPRMPLEGRRPRSDYLAMVVNMYERPACDVWPISLRQPLPVLPIPLLRPDPAVSLDIGQALRTAYQRARYDLRIDYGQPPDPPLSAEDAVWAANLLTTQPLAE